MTIEEVAALQYFALQGLPCRCQMVGGHKWHLQAKTEVARKCSRCIAMDAYHELKLPSSASSGDSNAG